MWSSALSVMKTKKYFMVEMVLPSKILDKKVFHSHSVLLFFLWISVLFLINCNRYFLSQFILHVSCTVYPVFKQHSHRDKLSNLEKNNWKKKKNRHLQTPAAFQPQNSTEKPIRCIFVFFGDADNLIFLWLLWVWNLYSQYASKWHWWSYKVEIIFVPEPLLRFNSETRCSD